MKRVSHWVLGAFLALPTATHATEFYFYLNGDNDLITVDEKNAVIHQAELTLKTIEKAATDSKNLANFHVYYDPHSGVAGTGARTDSRILRYVDGKKKSDESLGETDSTDPQHLDRLLGDRLRSDGPRVLVLWGHGRNWREIASYDYSNPEKSLQYLALADLIARHQIDLVIFDACQMGAIEALSAFANKTTFLIASQFDQPVEGVFYGGLSNFLKAEAKEKSNTRQYLMRLYDSLRKATRARAKEQGKEFVPIVFYDLTQFDYFREFFNRALADFHAALGTMENWQAVWSEIVAKTSRTPGQVDLRGFAHYAKLRTRVDTEPMLIAFERMLYPQVDPTRPSAGYGSAGFFMPAEYGLATEGATRSDAKAEQYRSWNLGLENWNWVRQWLRGAP